MQFFGLKIYFFHVSGHGALPSRRRDDEQQIHHQNPPRSTTRPNSKASSRELELRNDNMGDVLDRVLEWNRRYEGR